MRKIIDVSVNFRPNTEIGIYAYLGIPKEKIQRVEPEQFITQMDEAGVAMAGLVASVVANGVGGKILATHADDVAAVVKAYPDRFFGWVGVNPLARAMKTLRYIEYGIKELGFKGVHVYPHWFGYPINDRIYYPIYSKCAELGVPIALQVGTNTPRSGSKCRGSPHPPGRCGLSLSGTQAHRSPHRNSLDPRDDHAGQESRERLHHRGCPSPPAVGKSPDGLYQQEEWLNKDGSYKVMWGTDWPMQTFDRSLKEVRDLGFPPEIEERLLGENAIRIFGSGCFIEIHPYSHSRKIERSPHHKT